jgi:predicted metal-dependent HD superfamily phosphohydrolase
MRQARKASSAALVAALRVDPAAETRLLAQLEELTKAIGGINLAANIFRLLETAYGARQERYHQVRRVSSVPGGVHAPIAS